MTPRYASGPEDDWNMTPAGREERKALFAAYGKAHGYTDSTVMEPWMTYRMLQELRDAEQALFDITNGAAGSNWRPAAQLPSRHHELPGR